VEELEQVWTNQLNEAAERARAAGRGDVADYLALRLTNDFLRATSVRWLFEAATEIAAEANRRHANLIFEKDDPHRFTSGHATLVGARISFRQGVRCFSIEAGWTRTPSDGFMRGGALALARLTHFGLPKQNSELVLLKIDNAPVWFALDAHGGRSEFHSQHLQNHFRIFLDAV
jgi:hypothetical protein